MRFDVPVVGLPTIETMSKANARCLAVEAGRTLLFDRDALVAYADTHNIAVVGIESHAG
jgi:DUF1009 family protein